MANKLEKILGIGFLAGVVTIAVACGINCKPAAYVGSGVVSAGIIGIGWPKKENNYSSKKNEIYNMYHDRSDGTAD